MEEFTNRTENSISDLTKFCIILDFTVQEFFYKWFNIYGNLLYTPSNLPSMNRWRRKKPATIKLVNPHFFVWIKPTNVRQVIGQLQNQHDLGRSLVSFWLSEKFAWESIVSPSINNFHLIKSWSFGEWLTKFMTNHVLQYT